MATWVECPQIIFTRKRKTVVSNLWSQSLPTRAQTLHGWFHRTLHNLEPQILHLQWLGTVILILLHMIGLNIISFSISTIESNASDRKKEPRPVISNINLYSLYSFLVLHSVLLIVIIFSNYNAFHSVYTVYNTLHKNTRKGDQYQLKSTKK